MSPVHIATPEGKTTQHEKAELLAMWEQGELKQGTLYWIEGMAEWQPIAELFRTKSGSDRSLFSPALSQTGYVYTKDPRSLTSFVVVMLWICLLTEALMLFSDIGQLLLLNREFTPEEANANDVRQTIVALLYTVVFFVTGIGFLKWIHRANTNCRGFGAEEMQFTPGWSVGYYFVPLFCLIKPFQSMKEIWQISSDPSNWKSQATTSLLDLWWGLWLFNGFLGQLYFRVSLKADTVNLLIGTTVLGIANNLFGIALCFCAASLIKSIAAKQEHLVGNA